MASWIPISSESDFSLDNLPFGIFSRRGIPDAKRQIGVALGKFVIDLGLLAKQKSFQDLTGIDNTTSLMFQSPTLNEFASKGRAFHGMIRHTLKMIFSRKPSEAYRFLYDDRMLCKVVIVKRDDVVMHLPMEIGNYTNFCAGLQNAYTVTDGYMLRDQNPVPFNYKTMPLSYNGRASSVIVSETPVVRPRGQFVTPPKYGNNTIYSCPRLRSGPSHSVDFELQIGFFICKPNKMGEPIDVNNANDHIFGYVLLNDWSARDIQSYEQVPLGAFNGKNFATSISPWVVLAEALEPFHKPIIYRSGWVVPYLDDTQLKVFDMNLEVSITLPGQQPRNVTEVSSNNINWSYPQMVAHHTISGCPLQTGDLIGTGIIRESESNCGSFLEKSKNGTEPFYIANGFTRTFLRDGDTITLSGFGYNPVTGDRVGFGECTGTIWPARPLT